MRNTSLRDLKLADTLSHMSEVQIINPANDHIMKAVLAEIGYDVSKAFTYVPSFHRDLQGNTGVGFQVIGEYSLAPKYRHYLDAFDRIVVVGLTDPTFARELAEIAGKRFSYTNVDETENKTNSTVQDPRYYSDEQLKELGYSGFEDDNPEDEFIAEHGGVEKDCDMIISQVAALNAILISLRGE